MTKNKIGNLFRSEKLLVQVTLSSWKSYTSAMREARAQGQAAYRAMIDGDDPVPGAAVGGLLGLKLSAASEASRRVDVWEGGKASMLDAAKAAAEGGGGDADAPEGSGSLLPYEAEAEGEGGDGDGDGDAEGGGDDLGGSTWTAEVEAEVEDVSKQVAALRDEFAQLASGLGVVPSSASSGGGGGIRGGASFRAKGGGPAPAAGSLGATIADVRAAAEESLATAKANEAEVKRSRRRWRRRRPTPRRSPRA